MSVRIDILVLIVLASLVTWLPRVLPFLLSSKIRFSPKSQKFLSFLPIAILVALLTQSFISLNEIGRLTIDSLKLLAAIPTLLVSILTKNLMWTVLVGMITMALLRFFVS
ncbi:AzlD domain-containing protein [Vagococcus lutrae]|uniref:AzlD domain-containing protein n=1 Tax=Vagococcus lutrae TaxID=81947 RepID=UPI00200E3586|nr:AzlD domain-containing protein [Vagococcus lutrae]UQF23394.1 AzlD domain-containing protein [Vagococcus lutrae]UQF38728.1 AzlD domain-containing protein [Vagococcus lutrae]UQF64522.1 AzlD domain-containing protein [Vagococcus lutrae]